MLLYPEEKICLCLTPPSIPQDSIQHPYKEGHKAYILKRSLTQISLRRPSISFSSIKSAYFKRLILTTIITPLNDFITTHVQ
jgi:hypothetical protein